MTDNKIPMPASAAPTDPNAHGLYDSPVYTLAGEYKRPQGTQPMPYAPPVAAGGGGGAAGAAMTAEDEFAGMRFDDMVEGFWDVPTDDPLKPLILSTLTQRTASGTSFLFEGAKYVNAVFGYEDTTRAGNKLTELSRNDRRLLEVCGRPFHL